MTAPFLVDSHLDLALNALEWNRDLTRPIEEIRAAEAGLRDKAGRGCGTVCLPELRRGRIGLVVATQMARVRRDHSLSPVATWRSPGQAWAVTQGQRAWYRALEEAGEITPICSRADLEKLVALWRDSQPGASDRLPIGYLSSLEGADSLITLDHLERAVARGLRALVPHQRHLADDQIRALIERDAVIGVALDACMLVPGWVRGQTTPQLSDLRLEKVIDHIDHICQIAGDARHVGLGSDLDGGFGREQTPLDLETIADVARLPAMLLTRGYSADTASNFAHGNFLRFLRRALR